MSLRLRRIALDGFRKFREPTVIDGLTDGLNIIIEANETGKSTLLEALRAAFFVRHNTKNQLAQSYAPHGEAVGPEIQVAFEANGALWSVSKRFLRSPSVEVVGPQGKAQGEEAESRLNALFGSVKDTSRGGDVSTYGALGLLWVAQAEALSVTGPGAIVRDTVRSTLEAEVGSIMGGPAYNRVRGRIDTQFDTYWTPTGQKKGRQNEARERLETAETAAREAAERLGALERSFADLETARTRLKGIERDIADATDQEARRDLVAALETARAAAQILATRRAEQEAASGRVRALEDLQRRHAEAAANREKAGAALSMAREKRATLAAALATERGRVADAKSGLERARAVRKEARDALALGEARHKAARRKVAIAAARDRHCELLDLEARYSEAKATADTLIPAKVVTGLEALDRGIAEARAAVNADATRITFSGPPNGILINDLPIAAGVQVVTRETRIRMGESELVITPPAATESAEATLASLIEKQRAALGELGVADLTAARARNDAARDALGELRALEARIGAATPADEIIDLAAGAGALKLFVAGLEAGSEPDGDLPDLASLTRKLEEAETALARADGVQESAIEALRRVEQEDTPLATAEAGAASDLANATAQVEAIEARPEFATLTAESVLARDRAADAGVKLADAERDATTHDAAAITRKIETIDARARSAGEARTRLDMEIARLEATIESEGGKGLAERSAAAADEVEASRAALQRVTEEADTLKLLRAVLDEARNETSAKFVGPVAKRAKRHIERLLPDCELIFSEDLTLEQVIRGGVGESCAHLSRGTQEQLAVLTRIAFADMLLEQGMPVSLILDDPLVYSDDARLDLMIEILLESASRMQVVLLTCRDRAFRHVVGNRITMK